MPRSPAALDALIQELDEVRVLAGKEDDPALAEASLAVARALAMLNHLGRQRFRRRLQPDDTTDQVIADARRALARAREALAQAAGSRHHRAEAAAAESGALQHGAVAVSCCGCGRRFFVQYQGSATAAAVVFPMACPWEECDGVTEVAYPEDAVQVEVLTAVR
jgi:hypothetical protein